MTKKTEEKIIAQDEQIAVTAKADVKTTEKVKKTAVKKEKVVEEKKTAVKAEKKTEEMTEEKVAEDKAEDKKTQVKVEKKGKETTEDQAEEPTEPTGPTFADWNLRPTILASLTSKGYTTPTPIQELTFKHFTDGHHIVGESQT